MSSRLPLGTHSPPDRSLAITFGLALKELPASTTGAEFLFIRLTQHGCVSILVCVDAGLRLSAALEGLQSRGTHSALARKLLHPTDVHCAPSARRLSRRETDPVAVRINRLAQTIDPAHAESFIHGLGPGNAWPTSSLLVKAHPQFSSVSVMSAEPTPKVRRCGEKDWGVRQLWFHFSSYSGSMRNSSSSIVSNSCAANASRF